MGNRVNRASDLTTGRPTVIFGTKCPSITSTCNTSAPPRSTALICSPRQEKSADRIEGAISIALLTIFFSIANFQLPIANFKSAFGNWQLAMTNSVWVEESDVCSRCLLAAYSSSARRSDLHYFGEWHSH